MLQPAVSLAIMVCTLTGCAALEPDSSTDRQTRRGPSGTLSTSSTSSLPASALGEHSAPTTARNAPASKPPEKNEAMAAATQPVTSPTSSAQPRPASPTAPPTRPAQIEGSAVPIGAEQVNSQAPDPFRLDQAIYYDQYGLIVHKGSDGSDDGGDTAQREGWYWVGVWLRQHTKGLTPWPVKREKSFQQVVALLEPNHDGVIYRHPKEPKFNKPYDKEWGTSRDQIIPLIVAMGLYGMHDAIKRVWYALPEDAVGKHAFNGNWRNWLGQDGMDCSAIKKRGCDATASCPLEVDTRSCPLKVDDSDCSLQVDTRSCSQTQDCSLQVDTRSCTPQEDTRDCSFHEDQRSCHHWYGNDPTCEIEKAAENERRRGAKLVCEAAKGSQNAIYKAAMAPCESAKGAQNVIYAAAKATCEANKESKRESCEVQKAGQNVIYVGMKNACEARKTKNNSVFAAEKASCESGKAGQNAVYAGQKASCEAAKTGAKYACEAQKAADQVLCMATNVFSGDIMGPDMVNLFRRALGENPLDPLATSLTLPPIDYGSGTVGEEQTIFNVGERIVSGNDKDNVDDLNLIITLLNAAHTAPSPLSNAAAFEYARNRPYSYGSYFDAYRAAGYDGLDMINRMNVGIGKGWLPDVSPVFGTLRWYHRVLWDRQGSRDVIYGANPELAELYRPIIDRFFPH